ncbi:cytidylyltransferase domain-containing protein [Arcicella rosea]|uniref:N-acylneuraminate cytidylyltransferase n=1 Tax=Arcicella rosea TaxID=502909 RepID=A0A841ELV5_9BACT|nr:acylneuraminate cytidylyltransferase family protein [Arcicella rosea]MBB6002409.1 N-acylneuraminate cytidylyltransferase [Arcicella rosea]
MKITAVIPVRIGSQRVKNKNLKPFGDTTLLALKIDNLLKVKGISEIIVNTDSEEAIELAKFKGVAFHRREDYFASSQCTNSEFLQHLGLVTETDIFAYCPCTTPFIKPSTIQEAIDLFLLSNEHDCLATVSTVKEFLWLDGNPINYERDKQPNSQNLPNIYALNFGLNLISRDNLIKYKNIVGQNPIFTVTNEIEGLDIDTPLDFFVAEQIYYKGQDSF